MIYKHIIHIYILLYPGYPGYQGVKPNIQGGFFLWLPTNPTGVETFSGEPKQGPPFHHLQVVCCSGVPWSHSSELRTFQIMDYSHGNPPAFPQFLGVISYNNSHNSYNLPYLEGKQKLKPSFLFTVFWGSKGFVSLSTFEFTVYIHQWDTLREIPRQCPGIVHGVSLVSPGWWKVRFLLGFSPEIPFQRELVRTKKGWNLKLFRKKETERIFSLKQTVRPQKIGRGPQKERIVVQLSIFRAIC